MSLECSLATIRSLSPLATKTGITEANRGLWPATVGVETVIPDDRKVDGIAEVTFQSALSPVKGRAQTALAFKDEVNVFRRTLLYAGAPGTSRWYDATGPADTVGVRAVVYLRRRDGVATASAVASSAEC